MALEEENYSEQVNDLRRVSEVAPTEFWGDQSAIVHNADPELQNMMVQLVEECQVYYDLLKDPRDRRERSRKYYRGDQWSDLVTDPEDQTKEITEESLILRHGKTPIVNNQIRQLVKNLLGQYRQTDFQPRAYPIKVNERNLADMMTNALNQVYKIQELAELDARMFEENALSGYKCQRIYDHFDELLSMTHIRVDNVNMTRMFWNSDVYDPRLKDLRVIGMLHDMHINEAIQMFAKNEEDEEFIRDRLGDQHTNSEGRADYHQFVGSDIADNMDFYWTHDSSKVRIIEVWRQELIEQRYIHDIADGMYYKTDLTAEDIQEMNEARAAEYGSKGIPLEEVPLMQYETRKENAWVCYFLDWKGNIYYHSVSPHDHGEHPFSIGLYPLVDGEFWGFIEDIIDQQRQINRTLSLMDFMMGAGAKGVLFFPEELIPEGWDEKDVDMEFRRFNGAIFYKGEEAAKKGIALPTQITANTQQAGASEFLAVNLQLLKEISGVTESMQGQRPAAGTPASLYAQQTNNAALSTQDMFENFNAWKRKRDLKIIRMMQQYYDEQRMIYMSGKEYRDDANTYDPDRARDIVFDITIAEGSNNPAHRMVQDQFLMEFWKAGGIDVETFLENSGLPFAENLLETIKQKDQQLQEEGANPDFLKMLGLTPGGGPTNQSAASQVVGNANGQATGVKAG